MNGASGVAAPITPTMARRIELWPTDRLVPYAKNARTHSPEQVAQIAASIAEFGFNAPILVDSNAGIIAGHGRLLAARKLGLAEVPVVVLDHLSDTQRRAYIIADNKLALNAGWDDTLLAEELRDLDSNGLDLALVGFTEDELAALIGEDEHDQDPPEDEEAIPEAPWNPVSRPRDVWTIGQHRLICGDCRDAATVTRLMAGAHANVAITSPPYATQREYDKTSGFTPSRMRKGSITLRRPSLLRRLAMSNDRVWMCPPFGQGEPKEVDATPAVLVPLMVAGYSQCAPPATEKQEVTTDVHG